MSTQEWGASHDGFGVLASTTFPLLPNHKFVHDLPRPSWAERKVITSDRPRPLPGPLWCT